jgi:hypothetical protein
MATADVTPAPYLFSMIAVKAGTIRRQTPINNADFFRSEQRKHPMQPVRKPTVTRHAADIATQKMTCCSKSDQDSLLSPMQAKENINRLTAERVCRTV